MCFRVRIYDSRRPARFAPETGRFNSAQEQHRAQNRCQHLCGSISQEKQQREHPVFTLMSGRYGCDADYEEPQLIGYARKTLIAIARQNWASAPSQGVNSLIGDFHTALKQSLS
jgi:hypothetical protein